MPSPDIPCCGRTPALPAGRFFPVPVPVLPSTLSFHPRAVLQALASLAAAGHQPSRPSVFVLEGLIGYLTREAGNRLLAGLRGLAAPGSLLLMTAPPTAAWRDELAARGTKLHHVTFETGQETAERWVGVKAREGLARGPGAVKVLKHHILQMFWRGTGSPARPFAVHLSCHVPRTASFHTRAFPTCRRARAAGWATVLLGAEELGRKYGQEDNRFELIVGVA